ncbi:MAG: hypothetical protein U0R79_02670 [Propionicimonas sp.]
MKCSTSRGFRTPSHTALRRGIPSRDAIRGTRKSIAATASRAGTRMATTDQYGCAPVAATTSWLSRSVSGGYATPLPAHSGSTWCANGPPEVARPTS